MGIYTRVYNRVRRNRGPVAGGSDRVIRNAENRTGGGQRRGKDVNGASIKIIAAAAADGPAR